MALLDFLIGLILPGMFPWGGGNAANNLTMKSSFLWYRLTRNVFFFVTVTTCFGLSSDHRHVFAVCRWQRKRGECCVLDGIRKFDLISGKRMQDTKMHKPHNHLWADCLRKYEGDLTSHTYIRLQGLLKGYLASHAGLRGPIHSGFFTNILYAFLTARTPETHRDHLMLLNVTAKDIKIFSEQFSFLSCTFSVACRNSPLSILKDFQFMKVSVA
jgi:hypothetical protein